ncbi:MAG TPA: DegT/DnrJ/EryC1/StrS family aminotransferase [Gaiellaceae bacterium]|jgi:dTDP-4-amino-4,6-dideoxygalactose transaminase
MATVAQLALNGGPKTVSAEDHRRWPEITDEDRAEVMAVLDRGVLSGPEAPTIAGLEADFAAFVGTEYCIATNSGTSALHCCVAGVGVKPGDEVIVPAHTFIATAAAVGHQGAIPVFCDIDERTFNIDPSKIEERITERTTAIMPVHLHGLPADMDEIKEIAGRHGLAVIEDAAQSHGATYRNARTGGLADCAGFSLNATKNLSGGEGGVFTTNDPEIFAVARRLTIFGENVPRLGSGEFRAYVSDGLGYNYRNQELPSAFARSQLRRLPRYNETAQRNGAILAEGLAGITGLTPPYVPDDRTSVYHKYRVLIDPEALGFDGPAPELRDRLVRAFRAEGVEAVLWQVEPIPAFPAFRRKTYAPWHPKLSEEKLADWDPAEYPVTSKVLSSSLIIASEEHPLFIQDASLIERYVEGVDKVIANLDEVLAAPFEPVPLK